MAIKFESPIITLRQLQYAVAVAETLSFRKAASLCHVAQPSLSTQIVHLEETLGVRLFERDRRRVLVTAAGREIVERARAVLREAEDLVQIARAGDPLSGTLRIGVIPTISAYLLPKLSSALRAAYERLTIRWVEDKTEVLMESLEAGTLDAALVALEADLGEVEQEIIGMDPFVLALPKKHPLASKRPARPVDIEDARVLLLDDGHCFRDQALAVCASANARELEFRATSLSTLAQMVAGGAGVTLLPRMAVATEAKRADLVIRPFAKPVPKRTIAMVWRKRCAFGPSLRALAETVRGASELPAR